MAQWSFKNHAIWIFNRTWRISTTPNTTKFFLIIFKLIQQSIMVILSCLAKKNQNLNSRKKSSVYYWNLRFQGSNACKLPFLVINWTFFLKFKFWFFFARQLKITIIACCISLKIIKKNLVVLGVVDMRQLLLNTITVFSCIAHQFKKMISDRLRFDQNFWKTKISLTQHHWDFQVGVSYWNCNKIQCLSLKL